MVALVAATVPILAAKIRGALSRACPRIERAGTDKLAYTCIIEKPLDELSKTCQ